jgi:16S rRNA (guanine1516-N2)-methyltransferase
MSEPAAPKRLDLFVTTALNATPLLVAQAHAYAAELNTSYAARRDLGLPKLFAAYPDARRLLVVQAGRLLLVDRNGHEFFYHPNMAFLRLGNLLRGGRDLLIEAAELHEGDSVLDATLGYASEAILCAHIVGKTGEVNGIEAVPELGLVVREGLKTVTTDQPILNDAMRRIQVIHLGHHLDYLRACPSRRYDVICFDPFFDEVLEGSEPFAPIRAFGDHSPLLAEALAQARRVARRRVLVKAVRWSDTLNALGITERCDSRTGKVVYGILPAT